MEAIKQQAVRAQLCSCTATSTQREPTWCLLCRVMCSLQAAGYVLAAKSFTRKVSGKPSCSSAAWFQKSMVLVLHMSLCHTSVSTVAGEEQCHLLKSLAALLHSNSRKVSLPIYLHLDCTQVAVAGFFLFQVIANEQFI